MCRSTIGEQTVQAVINLRAVLEAEGLTLADVVKTTVWLTAVDHITGMNAAYTKLFAEPYPARSTVISGLVADADIEIEAIAFDPLG
jgi:2-iminobutanoate/2-iminopropanoate deaminase